MNVNEVIKYPILTEKTYQKMQEDNIYTFAVDRRTNKVEVRKAVEFIFDVKVERVNILSVSKKPKRVGRFSGFTSAYKKAFVYLAPESKISFFPDEEKEAQKAAKTEEKVEAKEKEISEAEKKAAEKIAKAQKAKKEEK